MKKALLYLTVILLILNAAGALFGGWHLMMHPDGSSMGMTVQVLEHSPFDSFLIPGILLFFFLGMFSLVVLGTIVFDHRQYPWLIMIQGGIILGWILIQMILLQTVVTLQVGFGAIGLLLVVCAWMLKELLVAQGSSLEDFMP
ncbi:MAG: hypothetical protein R6U64_01305 [Bacteroidales bacterium]